MTKFYRLLCVAAVAVLLLAPAAFAQRPQGQRPGGPGGPGFQRSPTQLPRSIELSDDQKAKLAEIEKKYADKITALREKAQLTEEQRNAVREAMTKAREDNTPREQLREIMEKAINRTDDQKKAQEELTALTAEITKEVEGLLTEEQKKQLTEARERFQRGGQRPGARPEGRPGDRAPRSDT